MALKNEVDKLIKKYGNISEKVIQLSVIHYYDGVLDGKVKLKDGKTYEYKMILMEIGWISDSNGNSVLDKNCDGQRYYLVKNKEDKVLGYITEEFIISNFDKDKSFKGMTTRK